MSDTGLVWFRNDLRIKDNTSLSSAIAENNDVIGIYFFDPRHFETTPFGFKKTEQYRAKFLIESVTELKDNLENLNIPLFIYKQYPEDVFPQFLEDMDIGNLYMQREWTQEEVKVTNAVKRGVKRYPIKWKESYDQFLFHPDDIPFQIEKVPDVFTNFRKKCEQCVSVREQCNMLKNLNVNTIQNTTIVPTLASLGFDDFTIDSRSAFPFIGGESQALNRIQEYFWETKKLSYYKKTRNGLLGKNYSSKLSAWLANGSISARTIYYEIKKYEQEIGANESTYWLIFELIWRDFFKYISLKHGNAIFKLKGIRNKEYLWEKDQQSIQKWIYGETNEPFVNANMIELKYSGWMSNRGRQNVASFFAKNQELDWRIGAAYFESMLIDYDVHSNYGNWLYVAGVGNDPRDRKFNNRLQAERYDPQQKFQQLWLQPTIF